MSNTPNQPNNINTAGGAYIAGSVTITGGINIFGGHNTINLPPQPKPEDNLPLSNMPHHRNRNFVGRERELAEIEAGLHGGGAVALTALSGLGGVGKTSLAIEYAFRHEQNYRLIWWLRAESTTTLKLDLAALGQRLGLVAAETTPDNALPVVKSWLAQPRDWRWLLIYDNAESQNDLYELVAAGGDCLITSRASDWSQLTAAAVEVDVMTPTEAVKLLLRRSGDTDEAAALKLAEMLGYLPLALEQAGAYCRQTKKKLAAYADLFEREAPALLDKYAPTGHRLTVAKTFELAVQQVEKTLPTALDLLRLMAFLAPDPLAVEILATHADQLPEPLAAALANELQRDDMLATLSGYSLIDLTDNLISVHRLMQTVIRDLIAKSSPEASTLWARAALKLINAAFPDDVQNDVEAWPVCAELLPHAQMVCHYAETYTDRAEPLGRLLSLIGLYLRERASFGQALDFCQRAVAIVETTFAPNAPETAASINNLGRVLQDLGQLVEAKQCFERAMKIDEATYGPDHPNVARYVNNLGSVVRALGQPAEAKQCFERAIKINEATYGSDHPKIAICVNNLGGALIELGQLQEAKQCYERAITIDEAVYGPNHPIVATRINNLSRVLIDLGQLQEARQCIERAIKINEAAYGQHHPQVATNINNLGHLLVELGQLAEAKQCYEQAIEIDEAIFGRRHPQVALFVNNLAFLLYQEGNYNGAEAHMERVYNIRRQFLGEEHVHTLDSKKGLQIIRAAIAKRAAGR